MSRQPRQHPGHTIVPLRCPSDHRRRPTSIITSPGRSPGAAKRNLSPRPCRERPEPEITGSSVAWSCASRRNGEAETSSEAAGPTEGLRAGPAPVTPQEQASAAARQELIQGEASPAIATRSRIERPKEFRRRRLEDHGRHPVLRERSDATPGRGISAPRLVARPSGAEAIAPLLEQERHQPEQPTRCGLIASARAPRPRAPVSADRRDRVEHRAGGRKVIVNASVIGGYEGERGPSPRSQEAQAASRDAEGISSATFMTVHAAAANTGSKQRGRKRSGGFQSSTGCRGPSRRDRPEDGRVVGSRPREGATRRQYTKNAK
jgi:hypothetical protein